MAYRIVEVPGGRYQLANESGNLAYTTEGSVYLARELAEATEALAYLNQTIPARALGRRRGSHRMKSIFGVEG